jgi:SAM-dependent methyltransferase
MRVRRYGSPALNGLPDSIRKSADMSRVQHLWREVRPVYEQDPACAAKYADPGFWLLLNTERAGRLGLHAARGLRVLDIGCGPGYFMAAAGALGHHCDGIDAPESYFTPVERQVYPAMLDSLRCHPHVSPLLIERFVPLPFHGRDYDLITAFWICFNRHRQPDEWGVEEWRFFVEDAWLCLREGGRLFLELNENPERYGELRYCDAPTLSYFSSVGTVHGGRVLLPRPAIASK